MQIDTTCLQERGAERLLVLQSRLDRLKKNNCDHFRKCRKALLRARRVDVHMLPLDEAPLFSPAGIRYRSKAEFLQTIKGAFIPKADIDLGDPIFSWEGDTAPTWVQTVEIAKSIMVLAWATDKLQPL